MKRNSAFIYLTIVFFIFFFIGNFIYCTGPDVINENILEESIQNIYDVKCKGMMTGDYKKLKEYYDTTRKYAQWSYEHEAMRIKYLDDWIKNRGAKFTEIKSEVDLKKVRKKDDMYLLSINETHHFHYVYEDDIDEKVNSFKVFLNHSVGLVYKDDKWLIARDWYSDCFENALGPYSGIYIGSVNNMIAGESEIINSAVNIEQKYNREKAVEYADKYYADYNSKYKDCNGIGGDCTNYVSQCIGDKDEGGGIAFDYTWFCVYPKNGRAEGSKAFVNTDAFKSYLVYSGRGRVIKRGDFDEVTAETKDSSIGAVGYLQLGDLICFEKKGQIDHFSIITAKDSKGYPMINSHTVERYHVPFDLGWQGKGIKFHLIKIAY